MYIADLIYLFISPLAFSLFYLQLSELYEIYILKTRLYSSRNININQLNNKGLILGMIFGLWRFVLGEPILYYYLK